jgi:hypothetical protein
MRIAEFVAVSTSELCRKIGVQGVLLYGCAIGANNQNSKAIEITTKEPQRLLINSSHSNSQQGVGCYFSYQSCRVERIILFCFVLLSNLHTPYLYNAHNLLGLVLIQ